MPILKRALFALATTATVATAPSAHADLKQSQVLVVYDSRIADSRAVAEYYAGSVKVPGGTGGRPGARPGVNVVDLASLPSGGVSPQAAEITYTTFVNNFRTPLRTYLSTTSQAKTIRCIVLTKGIPHRIWDTDNAAVGDQPAQAGGELGAGDATYSSLDSELTMLFQTLNTGEAGGQADSRSDGMIVNPYARSSNTITGYSTTNIQAGKSILTAPSFVGQIWRHTSPFGAAALTPGDIYLVCRLDGLTTQNVFDSIDRAQNITVDVDTACIVLDEQSSLGVQNVSDSDAEFDNDGPTGFTNAGDDYEQARDFLLADGRFLPGRVYYNGGDGAANFVVGPRVNFGGGFLVNGNVLLLATLGNNHSTGIPGTAGITYADSFNYAPGAVFNTIESFNGRQFGGLNMGFTPQEQLSDFIAAGGTLGIGNVWEPFSLTVGDNNFIVRNFLLGDMTWAEAAYTALPVLSWQQIVVGDPLARVRRVKEDVNADGVNNLEDVYAWFTAPTRPDLNRSGAADNADAMLEARAIRGSESGNMKPDYR